MNLPHIVVDIHNHKEINLMSDEGTFLSVKWLLIRDYVHHVGPNEL
jgi:hypothetical protein